MDWYKRRRIRNTFRAIYGASMTIVVVAASAGLLGLASIPWGLTLTAWLAATASMVGLLTWE